MPDKGKRKAASSAADGAAPAASGKQREEKERAGLDVIVKQGSEGLPRQDPAAGPVGTKYSSPTMRGSSGRTTLISSL